MAFHFSKRKIRPKEDEESTELNIVPYLDILMNLIIFILLSMSGLAAFGILNVSAPTYGGGGGGSDEKPPLTLTVGISPKGYYVAATGAVLPGVTEGAANVPLGQGEPTIPKLADGTYDFAKLTELMKKVKSDFPQESKVIVAAEAETQYEALVGTMDATRETAEHKLLFPDVTLATF
jgi:biopolymer transport protein TolR